LPDTPASPSGLDAGAISARSIADAARVLYADSARVHRLMQVYRSSICPLELVLGQIPRGSRVLDVGCGSGVVLGTSATAGILSRDPTKPSIGFDSSAPAIATAQGMVNKAGANGWLEFRHLAAEAPWPESEHAVDPSAARSGAFDVVTIVDVMHHVAPNAREGVIHNAAAALKPGGTLIYKDMVPTTWRAWMNRLHDLVMAKQWISYTPAEVVERWATRAGLKLVHRADVNRLWYGHQMRVFVRPRKGEPSGGGAGAR
jgi:2-polyprenyl-3-methyl-5-hydroxy-6-metoxy-1,4-benzoquinol methylase